MGGEDVVAKRNKVMTENEKKIFHLIQKNPYISQQELAASLGLSRPSVANIISGLVRKNVILGKAYILNESEPIVCIGGANVDRKYYVKDKVQWGTSNPITSSQTAGGVARNIAENLGRMDLDSLLITAAGMDSDWSFIKETSALYMDVDHVASLPEASTGSYTAVLDQKGEMVLALADMEVYESITPEFLLKHDSLLNQARCIVADLNCPKESLQLLVHKAQQYETPLVLVTVSSPKMSRLPDDLEGVTWLITNQDESETGLEMKLQHESDWKEAIETWLSRGISNTIITNGKNGAFIGNREEGVRHVPSVKSDTVVDVTGAGDAFSAAVVYAWLDGRGLEDIAKTGMVNAAETLKSPYTVRQNLSSAQLQKDMEAEK
ncbi:MAG TPA: carbohydrate kinase [Bacillales bacterium]|nr:carbohydrate kinase [Bacillales bacterium]